MSETDTIDIHDCSGFLEPDIQAYHGKEDRKVISGALGDQGVTIFMTCRKCGRKFDANYQLDDIEPYSHQ